MKNRNIQLNDDWATDPNFYRVLNDKYRFDFDPCPWHHDMSWDGLEVEWGQRNYVNPPYSDRKETGYLKSSFVQKAIEESRKGKLCVLLLPVSTSTRLFHQVILPNITNPVEFVERRIPFIGVNDKGQKVNHHLIQEVTKETILFEGKEIPMYIRASGQHDSMIVVFDGRK